MERMARLFFWGYMLMLLGIGGSGIFIAAWELPHIFEVRLDSIDELHRATILSQYRFLKGIELGFGVFCWAFRNEIFLPRTASRVFLGGLCAGVAARVLSCIVDGIPTKAFIAFCVLEAVTGFLVWGVVWRGRTS
ncbi:DUF4345 domain-containing protein [Paraburkholderia aromaticivorans]|uniref:DUF4345 domain-containing protein n=1 Tax=Paraburkholderia aromaticivorans TaxID=2026199 RepID=UPI00145602A4|nr:DUF4345 domain-containing protein [Paraburkholderia aromaticivorans]